MRPAPFDYYAPTSFEEALDLLKRLGPDARILAGGQSLIPLMNFRLARPAALIDLARLLDLNGIMIQDGHATIGAMVTHAQIEHSRELQRSQPLLPAAARYIGHEAIRNRGTLGGSLAHADPLAEWPAVVTVLGGRIKAVSLHGSRWIAAPDFFIGPLLTMLAPDEVITEVEVPVLGASTGWSFQELARRPGDFALVGIAVVVTLDRREKVVDLRVSVVGGGIPNFVPPIMWEGILGRPAENGVLQEATMRVSEALAPPEDIHATAADRRQIARVLTFRALKEATARARSRSDPG